MLDLRKRRLCRVCKFLACATLALAAMLLSVPCATAQDPYVPPTYHAPRIEIPPVIDGQLDDACWRMAPVASFKLRANADIYHSRGTTARVVWDDENLYIGFRCAVPDVSKLTVEATERDGAVWLDDAVEVFLQSDPAKSRQYAQFVVNAAAVQLDTSSGGVGANAPWDAAALVGEAAWFAEIEIPWESVSSEAHPREGDRWRVLLGQDCQVQGAVELSAWITRYDAGQRYFHQPERFGDLIFDDPGPREHDPWPAETARDVGMTATVQRMRAQFDRTRERVDALREEMKDLLASAENPGDFPAKQAAIEAEYTRLVGEIERAGRSRKALNYNLFRLEALLSRQEQLPLQLELFDILGGD